MDTLADEQMRQFKTVLGYDDLPEYDDLPGWVFRIREAAASAYEVIGRDTRGHQIAAAAGGPDEAIAAARRDARAFLNAENDRSWKRFPKSS